MIHFDCIHYLHIFLSIWNASVLNVPDDEVIACEAIYLLKKLCRNTHTPAIVSAFSTPLKNFTFHGIWKQLSLPGWSAVWEWSCPAFWRLPLPSSSRLMWHYHHIHIYTHSWLSELADKDSRVPAVGINTFAFMPSDHDTILMWLITQEDFITFSARSSKHSSF